MKKILIIEDDKSIAELQKDYLTINGYDVTLCHHGCKAMEMMSREDFDFDLIILDIMLPGLDGLTILKQKRADTDIPILVVSAKTEEVDKIMGLGLGADDYITKPFSPGELVARVQSHLSKYERLTKRDEKENKRKILNIRGMSIDLNAHSVKVDGIEINLAQKEYELLVFLAENPNNVFNREELFEKVWGMDSLGDSSTVTVHIGRIREKIEFDPSNPSYIETVWGAGYRIRV